MAFSQNAGQNWRLPPGGRLDPASLKQLEQAVNWRKGLHGDAFDRDVTIAGSGPASRLLLLDTQTIPVGVTVTILSGGVMRIL